MKALGLLRLTEIRSIKPRNLGRREGKSKFRVEGRRLGILNTPLSKDSVRRYSEVGRHAGRERVHLDPPRPVTPFTDRFLLEASSKQLIAAR